MKLFIIKKALIAEAKGKEENNVVKLANLEIIQSPETKVNTNKRVYYCKAYQSLMYMRFYWHCGRHTHKWTNSTCPVNSTL